MKKIIFISLFFSLSLLAGTADNINLSSEISPVCDVQFDAEPVAANLDLVNSQSDLYIGRLAVDVNTQNSFSYRTDMALDLADHLTHTVNSSYLFSFDHLKVIDQNATVTNPFPMANFTINDVGDGYGDMYLSYTGVPALTLVQGTYSATWYESCSIEPRT